MVQPCPPLARRLIIVRNITTQPHPQPFSYPSATVPILDTNTEAICCTLKFSSLPTSQDAHTLFILQNTPIPILHAPSFIHFCRMLSILFPWLSYACGCVQVFSPLALIETYKKRWWSINITGRGLHLFFLFIFLLYATVFWRVYVWLIWIKVWWRVVCLLQLVDDGGYNIWRWGDFGWWVRVVWLDDMVSR